jgi:N utilization substance protein B
MGKRRKARESTLQILFQLEFNDSQLDKTISQFLENKKADKEEKELCTRLICGIVANQAEIDKIIQSASQHWRISRMAIVDKNILRMAAYEMLYDKDLAPAIIINEAIEIAKKYSSEQSATFINGILDALNKKKVKDDKALKEVKHE